MIRPGCAAGWHGASSEADTSAIRGNLIAGAGERYVKPAAIRIRPALLPGGPCERIGCDWPRPLRPFARNPARTGGDRTADGGDRRSDHAARQPLTRGANPVGRFYSDTDLVRMAE